MSVPANVAEATNTFNPLNESVNEKSYAGGGGGNSAPVVDIAEPTFSAPPLDFESGPTREELSGDKKKPGAKKESTASPAFNSEMNELSDSDQKKAAEQSAQFAMTMYKGLHTLGNGFVQISEKKINKLQMEGEVDMNVAVPYGHLGHVRLAEFVTEFNNQSREVLTVSPEFEEAVMPPLTRVIAKRGAGMTDENYLMFMFGQDLIQKGLMIGQLKGTVKQIIEFAKEQTASSRIRPMQPTMSMSDINNHPGSEEPAPVININEHVSSGGSTLQEQALGRVDVSGTTDRSAMPNNLVDPNRVATMNDLLEKQLKEEQRGKKVRQGLGKKRVPKPRRTKKAGVPGPGKKKAGVPPTPNQK